MDSKNFTIDIDVWTTKVAKYSASMMAPFSSNEVKKNGYILLVISSILILIASNNIQLTDSEIFGIHVRVTRHLIEILIAICIYILTIYLFDITQEFNIWALNVLISDSNAYYPRGELEKIHSTLIEITDLVMEELDDNVEAMKEKLGLNVQITKPNLEGLPVKDAMNVSHEFQAISERRRENYLAYDKYYEEQKAILDEQLKLINIEREKLNIVLKMYELAVSKVKPVYTWRRRIEIIFPPLLTIIAILTGVYRISFH